MASTTTTNGERAELSNGLNGVHITNDISTQPELAIIGGGIVGLALALGLTRRSIPVKVYEQATSFKNIGAGLGFSRNALRCMEHLDPRILKIFREVAAPGGGDPENPMDYFLWVDGYTKRTKEEEGREVEAWETPLLFKLYCGHRGFEGCFRAHFIERLVELVPEGVVQLGKRLKRVEQRGDKMLVSFEDGSVVSADAVIGCDGIRSRVRSHVIGADHPSLSPVYTHKYAFRGVVPMEQAKNAVGEYKSHHRHMYIGPNAHVLTVPVANATMMNVVAFVTDPNDWKVEDGMTAPATKDEIEAAFADWNPAVRSVMSMLLDRLDKWAIFEHKPAPTFAKGRVCLLGDAAHAMAPHHGAGAGTGIEDALAMTTLLSDVQTSIKDGSVSKAKALETAFAAMSAVRYERSQFVVESSRIVGELFEYQVPHVGHDTEKSLREITWRSHRVWDYDEEEMMYDATREYKKRLASTCSDAGKGLNEINGYH